MFAVIFEVRPKEERWDDYLSIAKGLKPKLEAIDGFISNDRFRNVRDGRWLLSLSTWRDEKSLVRWRTEGDHHGAQQKGRDAVFADYHLRVGEIVADTGQSHLPTQRLDETEVGAAKAVTVTEVMPAGERKLDAATLGVQLGLDGANKALVGHKTFESIYTPGKLLLLASWRSAEPAGTFRPEISGGAESIRHRTVRIVRDYGMFERREAPQYYPAARAVP